MILALEGVIEVTCHLLEPDVVRCRHDSLVGIEIIYLAIKSQMVNWCRAVTWLTVVQQPRLKFNKYTVFEYIQIISEVQSTNFVSAVLFNLCMDMLIEVGNSETFGCISEWCYFDTSVHSRHDFLLNNIPVEIRCGEISPPENAGDIEDRGCKYFTVYWQRVVGCKHLKSQYLTSHEGHSMSRCPPYSKDSYTSHRAWASIKSNSPCW